MHEPSYSHRRCVILAAGPVSDADSLRGYLRDDDWIIAADGGLRLAQKLGITPSLLVADFDSMDEPMDDTLTTEYTVIRLPRHKDDTDTMAAAKMGLHEGFRQFLLLGATGGRLDHLMANFAVLHFLVSHGAAAVMADEHNVVDMHLPGQVIVEPVENAHLSLLPYAGSVTGLTVKNAAYELKNAVLTPDFPLGVSNEFIGKPVEIFFEQGVLLIFLSKD